MPLKLTRRPGSDNWHMRGTVRGARVFESTGTGDKRIAEEVKAQRERELFERALYGAERVVTFAEAAASYLEAEDRAPSTCARVARLITHFGTVKLREVDQVALDRAYRALCRPDAAGATKVRSVLTPLRAIMEHAAKRRWCQRPAFETPNVAKVSTDFLLPAQATALVQAASPHIRPLLVFLIGTGCRMSEALDLTWDATDLRGARARVWQKQGNERQVDLPPVVVAALASLPHREGNLFRPPVRSEKGRMVQPARYVDTGRESGGQIATAWARACRVAGLPGRMVEAKRPYFAPELGPHALRHTWASWHQVMHRDPLRLMHAGGWSSLAMVQRYAHLMPEAYADECRAWLAGGVVQARATA